MSSGKFTYSKYQSDAGDIYRIRVQPETLTATLGGTANAAPAGAIDAAGTVRVSNPRRGFGIKPRMVSIAWTTAPDGYEVNSPTRIPVLSQATYTGLQVGAAVSYNGGTGTVSGKSAEVVR